MHFSYPRDIIAPVACINRFGKGNNEGKTSRHRDMNSESIMKMRLGNKEGIGCWTEKDFQMIYLIALINVYYYENYGKIRGAPTGFELGPVPVIDSLTRYHPRRPHPPLFFLHNSFYWV